MSSRKAQAGAVTTASDVETGRRGAGFIGSGQGPK